MLSQAFEAAWARQPELAALAARRDAARAQQQAAQSWTPEPVAVEVTGKTDRLNRNLGTREYEAGLAIPLLAAWRTRAQPGTGRGRRPCCRKPHHRSPAACGCRGA